MRLVVFLFLFGVSVPAYCETEQLNTFQSQTANSLSSAAGSSLDMAALDYLQGKFNFSGQLNSGKPVLPPWYPEYYPTAAAMNPSAGTKPRIKLFSSASAGSTYYVPKYEILKVKSGANCVAADPVKLSYPPESAPTECLEGVRTYDLDSSSLGALQAAPPSGEYQNGFIGVVDMNKLDESQKSQLFSGSTPTLSRDDIDPRKIEFRKYLADPNNPQKLAGFEVRVGNTLAALTLPNTVAFPPAPNCQIEVLTAQPVRIGTTVKFNLLVNSITRAGSIQFHDDRRVSIPPSQVINTPVASIGSFVKVNTNPLELTFTEADDQDSRVQKTKNPNAPYEQLWLVTGNVSGVDASTSSQQCQAVVRVDKVVPPDCVLTVGRTQLLRNESTTATLDCRAGGPVTSATIKTYTGSSVSSDVLKSTSPLRITVNGVSTTDLSLDTDKVFQFNHTKTEVVKGETIVAEVTGPGGMRPFNVALGDVCPYNETSFRKVEIPVIRSYRTYSDKYTTASGEIQFPDVKFTMGYYPYTLQATIYNQADRTKSYSQTIYLLSGPASLWAPLAPGCIGYDGSWGGCWSDRLTNIIGYGGGEGCNSNNFCMMNAEYTADFGGWMPGGEFIWVEIGTADGKDGGKYDPQCTIKTIRTREGGCFAKNTPVMMADGKYKPISEIGEGDYVFNPHYGAGVRVSKVVKGPEKKALFEVVVDQNKIEVTEDHPFLTQRGWIQAMALKAGDQLFGQGYGKIVMKVQKAKYRGPQDVWNFELDSQDPLAKVVLANGIPTGELSTQSDIKKRNQKLP